MGREIDHYSIPLGAIITAKEGQKVKANQLLAKWDPHNLPILAERDGIIRFEDIIEGKTMKEEKDRGNVVRKMIIEHKGDLHPQIVIDSADGTPLVYYPIPERAYIEVDDGGEVVAGTLLAKTPREVGRTQDITGGLPRVTEIFEARKPKEPAIMAEIDGTVELVKEMKKGKRRILVKPEIGDVQEHLVPHGRHLRVQSGDYVKHGTPLIEGPLIPHDILRINGEEALESYLLLEVQSVYRSQGVTINDKHIEIIISQMMKKITVNDPGDSELLPGQPVNKSVIREINKELIKQKKKPATAEPLLLGITKAALQSDSMISAASFQETTKVLTEASISGKKDKLTGLKENVILGHMVPSGTGFFGYQQTYVTKPGQPEVEEVEAPETDEKKTDRAQEGASSAV